MPQDWPPPGHHSSYSVTEELGDGYKLTYDVNLPSGLPEFDVATLRIGRHGGLTPADRQFRAELFGRVGAVTIAGSEAETGMKRLLLLLLGESGEFSGVDKTWTDLHRELLDECTGTDARRLTLADVLAWGEEVGAKRRRDNVVHAYWWCFAGCGVRRSRFFRQSNGTVLIGSLEDLDEDAEVLFEYARRFDALLGSDWPRAMLPAI
jgi:hypothetical protein